MSDDDIIRSYHHVWERDMRVSKFGSYRPRTPIRARAFAYGAVFLFLYWMFAQAFLRFGILTLLGALIPLGFGYVLAEVPVRGRRVHDELRVRFTAARTSRYLAGAWWPMRAPGETIRFRATKRY